MTHAMNTNNNGLGLWKYGSLEDRLGKVVRQEKDRRKVAERREGRGELGLVKCMCSNYSLLYFIILSFVPKTKYNILCLLHYSQMR